MDKRNNVGYTPKKNECKFSVVIKKDSKGNYEAFDPNMDDHLPAHLVLAILKGITDEIDKYNEIKNNTI